MTGSGYAQETADSRSRGVELAAWGNPQVQQANPTWKFYPPPTDPATGEIDPADETSGALLTRMQTLLAATSTAAYPKYLIYPRGHF
jgi:hypothetical protein